MSPAARPFLPAAVVALSDVAWRVASHLAGHVPHAGLVLRPAELLAPWPVAVGVTALAAGLLATPGRAPALTLGAVQLVRLGATAIPLAFLALERLRGAEIFAPDHPEPVATELLHAALHAATLVLLVTGLRGHRRQLEEERLRSTLDAF